MNKLTEEMKEIMRKEVPVLRNKIVDLLEGHYPQIGVAALSSLLIQIYIQENQDIDKLCDALKKTYEWGKQVINE